MSVSKAKLTANAAAVRAALATLEADIADLPVDAVVAAPVPTPAPAPAPSGRSRAGVYCGNPNGSNPDDEAWFAARFAEHSALMGKPLTMNAFTDFTKDPSTWPDNAAWTAWSWMKSKAGLADVRPIVGIKLSDAAHWNGNPAGKANIDFYNDIIAGKFDGAYAGVAAAWVKAGFRDVAFRPGYEFDGSFMPDYVGSDPAVQAAWRRAFMRVSGLMKDGAMSAGATRSPIIWNPCAMNWTALSVRDSYPGNDYVDIHGLDVYSPAYNGALYNYDAPTYSFAADQQAWLARIENRRHYWKFPSANEWNQSGNGSGWGIRDAVAFAKECGKPFAICETGQGSANAGVGLVDDPEFPKWLREELDLAVAQGVAIDHVNVWNMPMDDGPWSFMAADKKPLAAAAWAKAFGAA